MTMSERGNWWLGTRNQPLPRARRSETLLAKQRLGRSLEPELEREV
jgi:hypothetical protein